MEQEPEPKAKLMFFGQVWEEFKLPKNYKGQKYLSSVNIFLIKGQIQPTAQKLVIDGMEIDDKTAEGFYGQAVVTHAKKLGYEIEVIHQVYPVRIDVEGKAFVVVGGTDIKDSLKIENIDSMIDKTISLIIEPPIGELHQVQLVDPEDVDSADFWKGNRESDPDWWKKEQKDDKPDSLPDMQIPDGL